MDETAEVEYDEIVTETEMAALFRIDNETVWIPKSVIYYDTGSVVELASWFAEKEGLV